MAHARSLEALDPKRTALVLIDVQEGILTWRLGPLAGPALAESAAALARQCKAAGTSFVRVRIAFAADLADKLEQPVDQPFTVPPEGLPAHWSTIAPALAAVPAEVDIVKHNWSAFHGTELDLQLRRRGIENVVLGGIATNFGVESTARDAWQLNYRVIVAEDACTSLDADWHAFSVRNVLPRMARVRTSAEIVRALSSGAAA